MKRCVVAAWIWLPILFGAMSAAAAKPRRVGKTPPNVVVEDRAGVKRRLPILKTYPESLLSSNPKNYTSRLVFVPDGSGRLKRMVIGSGYSGPTVASESKTYTQRMVDVMLTMLFGAAPHRFPRNSDVDDVEVKGSLLRLSLNQAFARADFWRSEARARAALYAVVNTALEYDHTGVKRVQILIEGKPIARLGALRTSRPLAPRLSLVSGP